MSYTFKDRRLVDVNGNILASDTLYEHSKWTTGPRRQRTTTLEDTRAAISQYDWQKSLSLSRKMYSRLGVVSGPIRQKASYVAGTAWEPVYAPIEATSKQKQWGQLAKLWLDNWLSVCNFRGEPFDFYIDQFLTSIAMDRCGDSLCIFTEENGQPRVQYISSHRIGTRYASTATSTNGYGTLTTGDFKGYQIYNGIIFNKRGKYVGVSIIGDTIEQDRYISASSCSLLYDPDWCDQGRGIPSLATSMLEWTDYEDIHFYLRKSVKLDSAMGVLITNEQGAPRNRIRDLQQTSSEADPNNADQHIEEIGEDDIWYFQAGKGERAEPYRTERPHPNVDAYLTRILRSCYQAISWPYELSDPGKLNGAATRMIQDQARAVVARRQNLLWKRATKIVAFGLSVAVRNRELPEPPEPTDYIFWDFTPPARLTVDQRYDDQSDMDMNLKGFKTMESIVGTREGQWQRTQDQWIKERKRWLDECKNNGITPPWEGGEPNKFIPRKGDSPRPEPEQQEEEPEEEEALQ